MPVTAAGNRDVVRVPDRNGAETERLVRAPESRRGSCATIRDRDVGPAGGVVVRALNRSAECTGPVALTNPVRVETPVPPSATTRSVMPVTAARNRFTAFAFWVAIVPRPAAVRSAAAFASSRSARPKEGGRQQRDCRQIAIQRLVGC